MVDEILAVQ